MQGAKIRLTVIFEATEGHSETDYVIVDRCTEVGTVKAIIRSHFMQKLGLRKGKSKRRDTFHSRRESLVGPGTIRKKQRADLVSSTAEPVGELRDCVALWDFEAEREDELSFVEGDIMVILEKPMKEWWKVLLKEKKGLIPASFVEEMPVHLFNQVDEDQVQLGNSSLYGLYLPSPHDVWLSDQSTLKEYDLDDFECVKYMRVPEEQQREKTDEEPKGGEVCEREEEESLPTSQSPAQSSRMSSADKMDAIESALRLFAGAGSMSVDVYIRDAGKSVSMEVSDAVLMKDLMTLLAKQLKGWRLPGFQKEDIRARDYQLICRPKNSLIAEDLCEVIPEDSRIMDFKGNIELVRAVVHLCVDVRMPTKASEGEEKETKGKSIILRLAAYASTRIQSIVWQIRNLVPTVGTRPDIEDFKLFLHPSGKGEARIVLDHQRTLRSYKFPEVVNNLTFRMQKAHALCTQMEHDKSVLSGQKIFLVIKAPKINASKTLALNTDMSVGDIIQEFVRKLGVTAPRNKVLRLYMEGSPDPLHPLSKIKAINANMMDCIVLKEEAVAAVPRHRGLRMNFSSKHGHGSSSSLNGSAIGAGAEHGAFALFGAELSSLKMGPDSSTGLHVPEFLLRLEVAMEQSQVLMSPDIFTRDCEDEAELARLLTHLSPFGDMNDELPIFVTGLDTAMEEAENLRPYSVSVASTALRQWLYHLPTRLWNHLSSPQLRYVCQNGGENCEEVFSYLPTQVSSTFSWLIKFLVKVGTYSHINQMTSTNLASVISPCLYGEQGKGGEGKVGFSDIDSSENIEFIKEITVAIAHLLEARLYRGDPSLPETSGKVGSAESTPPPTSSRSLLSRSWRGKSPLPGISLRKKKRKEKDGLQELFGKEGGGSYISKSAGDLSNVKKEQK